MTSSIRTKTVEDETTEDTSSMTGSKAEINGVAANEVAGSTVSKTGNISSDDAPIEEVKQKMHVTKTKELLLCLRPIRDGEGKVDESLSFARIREQQRWEENSSPIPERSAVMGEGARTSKPAFAAASNIDAGSGSGNTSLAEENATGESRRGPPKKRALPLHGSTAKSLSGSSKAGSPNKRIKTSSSDTEKSVVESLMLMSNK